MLGPTNFWMCLAGIVYLVAGIFILRKELAAARGWDKLVELAPVFIAVSLAAFAPEHFVGPDFVQNSVPSWMPAHAFVAHFVGVVLLAAATSLVARKFLRLSTTMLGLMFFLFVCMIYLPGVIAAPGDRFSWTFLLRDFSFCAGAWALARLYNRESYPRASKWLVAFARIEIGVAAVFFGVQHFLHPQNAPGVPLQLIAPSWFVLHAVWAYAAGAILLCGGLALAANVKARKAATSIGALITLLAIFPYLVKLLLAFRGSPDEVSEGLNYFADTLLFAGSALALAMALPREREHAN